MSCLNGSDKKKFLKLATWLSSLWGINNGPGYQSSALKEIKIVFLLRADWLPLVETMRAKKDRLGRSKCDLRSHLWPKAAKFAIQFATHCFCIWPPGGKFALFRKFTIINVWSMTLNLARKYYFWKIMQKKCIKWALPKFTYFNLPHVTFAFDRQGANFLYWEKFTIISDSSFSRKSTAIKKDRAKKTLNHFCCAVNIDFIITFFGFNKISSSREKSKLLLQKKKFKLTTPYCMPNKATHILSV